MFTAGVTVYKYFCCGMGKFLMSMVKKMNHSWYNYLFYFQMCIQQSFHWHKIKMSSNTFVKQKKKCVFFVTMSMVLILIPLPKAIC